MLFCTHLNAGFPLFMASMHTSPLVADIIEADEFVIGRLFEADAEGEETDVSDFSTGGEIEAAPDLCQKFLTMLLFPADPDVAGSVTVIEVSMFANDWAACSLKSLFEN